mgnify:FL=1
MKTNRILSRVLSGLLVALGFTGCDGSDTPEEYGTPSVKFQVKGTVTDEAGNPIENIRVIVRGNYDNEPNPWMDDTIYTDRDGNFASKEMDSFGLGQQRAYFDDVDGEENGGKFRSQSVWLKDMESKQVEKEDGWYDGKYEFTARETLKKEAQ